MSGCATPSSGDDGAAETGDDGGETTTEDAPSDGTDTAGTTAASGTDTGDSSGSSDSETNAADTESGGDETTTGTPVGSESSGDAAGFCGDGVVDPDEACDDAGASQNCTEQCTFAPGATVWETELEDSRVRELATDGELLWMVGEANGLPVARVLDAATGDLLHTIDLPDVDLAPDVTVDADGRAFAIGYTGFPFSGEGRVWRLEPDGTIAWTHVFAPPASPEFPPVPTTLAANADRITVLGFGFTAGYEQLDSDGAVLVSGTTPASSSFTVAATALPDGSVAAIGEFGIGSLIVTIGSSGQAGLLANVSRQGGRGLAPVGELVYAMGYDDDETWITPATGSEDEPAILPLDSPAGIVADPDGMIDAFGLVPGTLDFLVLEIDPDTFEPEWSATFPNPTDSVGLGGIAIDDEGRVFIGGHTADGESSVARVVSLAG